MGWEERSRTRFLGAVVPAALSQPTVILAVRIGGLNGLAGSKFWDPGISTRSGIEKNAWHRLKVYSSRPRLWLS